MRCIKIALFFLGATLSLHRAWAMFALHETEQVPIARVFTNIQFRLAANTNDFELTYCLARLSSMAYSTNLVQIGVRKDNDTPTFGWPDTDAGVPKLVQPIANPESRKSALGHLTNAIVLYERAIL